MKKVHGFYGSGEPRTLCGLVRGLGTDESLFQEKVTCKRCWEAMEKMRDLTEASNERAFVSPPKKKRPAIWQDPVVLVRRPVTIDRGVAERASKRAQEILNTRTKPCEHCGGTGRTKL